MEKQDAIKKLIDLLSTGFELEDKDGIVATCIEAYENPTDFATENELEFLLYSHQDCILDYLLPCELEEVIVCSDKIDEIHEQIEELLDGIPDFPFPDEERVDIRKYFDWVEKYLGDEVILKIGDDGSDNLTIFLVNKDDVEEVIYLSKLLNIQCKKTTEIF